MKDNLQTIIMAAGRSSRFKTNRSKLVEKICGQEMILYATKVLEKLKIPTTVIVGYKKNEIEAVISKQHGNKINFIEQKEQKGTAHALMCSQPLWQAEHLLIMNADMPLISASLITNLWQEHIKNNNAVSFVSAHNIDPSLDSYGKVIVENDEIKIIEAKDYAEMILTDPTKKTDSCCINAGIYIFKKSFLEQAIPQLQTSNVTGEFYITDLIHIASKAKLGVQIVDAPVDQIRGINTLRELWIAEQVKQAEIINHWMHNGVRFQSAQNSYVELNVIIGAGTFIGQGAQLNGNTDIDEDCIIEPFTVIDNSTIGKNCTIKSFSVIKDSHIKAKTSVGPLASINSGSIINSNSKIGNFVEVKASNIGTDAQIHSLAFVGNTHMGTDVQVGSGTVICDHNGITSSHTQIADQAFIGSNNTVVPPVKIETQAFTAAGSVITEDVPAQALAIARARQTNKPNYRKKLAAKHNFTHANKLKPDISQL